MRDAFVHRMSVLAAVFILTAVCLAGLAGAGDSQASAGDIEISGFDDFGKNKGKAYGWDPETCTVTPKTDLVFVLTGDVSGHVAFDGDLKVTLDLAGRTFSCSGGSPTVSVSDGTRFELRGTGTLSSSGTSPALCNGGSATCVSGNIAYSGTSDAAAVQNTGSLVLDKAVKVTGKTVAVSNGGKLIADGCGIVSAGTALVNGPSGKAVVDGGSFEGEHAAVSEGSLDIKSGTFSATGDAFVLKDGRSSFGDVKVTAGSAAFVLEPNGANAGSGFETTVSDASGIEAKTFLKTVSDGESAETATVNAATMTFVCAGGTAESLTIDSAGYQEVSLLEGTSIDCSVSFSGDTANLAFTAGEGGAGIAGGTSLYLSGDLVFVKGSHVADAKDNVVLDGVSVSSADGGSVVLPDIVRVLGDVTLSGTLGEDLVLRDFGGTKNRITLDGLRLEADLQVYSDTFVPRGSEVVFCEDTGDRAHTLTLVLDDTLLEVRGQLSSEVPDDTPVDNRSGYVKSYTDSKALMADPDRYRYLGEPPAAEGGSDGADVKAVLSLFVGLVLGISITAIAVSLRRKPSKK